MSDFKLPFRLKEKIPGLYIIADLSEAKAYIGSSTEIPRRLYTHQRKLNTNTHPNWQLQRAHNKGNELVCLPILVHESENTLELEQKLLDEFLPDGRLLNIAANVIAPTLGRECSLETRQKISLASLGRTHSDESREKIRQGHLGKKKNFSDEGRASLAKATGERFRGKKLSEEHKEKAKLAFKALNWSPSEEHKESCRKANRDKAFPVDINGFQYVSVREASMALGISEDTLRYRVMSDSSRFTGYKQIPKTQLKEKND